MVTDAMQVGNRISFSVGELKQIDTYSSSMSIYTGIGYFISLECLHALHMMSTRNVHALVNWNNRGHHSQTPYGSPII